MPPQAFGHCCIRAAAAQLQATLVMPGTASYALLAIRLIDPQLDAPITADHVYFLSTTGDGSPSKIAKSRQGSTVKTVGAPCGLQQTAATTHTVVLALLSLALFFVLTLAKRRQIPATSQH